MLYQVSNGSKYFGAEEVFENVQFEIKGTEKIAIVGRNGCGKTTFLKCMCGEETFDKAFEIAKNNENMSEDTRDLIEKGSNGFLEKLQYDNWEEYQKNERQEIKDLKTIEKYSGGKSR